MAFIKIKGMNNPIEVTAEEAQNISNMKYGRVDKVRKSFIIQPLDARTPVVIGKLNWHGTIGDIAWIVADDTASRSDRIKKQNDKTIKEMIEHDYKVRKDFQALSADQKSVHVRTIAYIGFVYYTLHGVSMPAEKEELAKQCARSFYEKPEHAYRLYPDVTALNEVMNSERNEKEVYDIVLRVLNNDMQVARELQRK